MRGLIQTLRARKEKQAGVLAPIMHTVSSDEEEAHEPISTLTTPVTKSDIALNLGYQVGTPYLMSRMGLFGDKKESLGEAVAAGFSPRYTPMLAAFELGGTLASPLSDPAYQSDRIGYFTSLGRGVQKNIQQIGEASDYARKNYGALGVPVQVFHGLLNPLHSTAYMANEIRKYMMGKQGEAVALRAERSIQDALEVSHAV